MENGFNGKSKKNWRIEELKMGLEIYFPRFCCWTRRQSKSNINGLLTLNKKKLSSKPITREKFKNEWLFWPAPKPLFWNGRIESFQKQTHYILKWTSYIESFFFLIKWLCFYMGERKNNKRFFFYFFSILRCATSSSMSTYEMSFCLTCHMSWSWS